MVKIIMSSNNMYSEQLANEVKKDGDLILKLNQL